MQPVAGQTVVELAYERGNAETALSRAARAAGCEVIDGLEALVRQGAKSFELWTGVEAPGGGHAGRGAGSRLGSQAMSLRIATAGESHGPALVAILTGLPAGLELDRAAIDADLKRRQEGYGRSPRQQIEQDRVEVLAGLRHGKTLGHAARARRPQQRPQELDVRHEPVAARGRAAGQGAEEGDAAAARPRRPRGRAQVRPRRRPQLARARVGAAHGRARRGRRRRQGDARHDRRHRRELDRRRGGPARGDRRGAQGARHGRRHRRGARAQPAARPRHLRRQGGSPRRAARRRRDGHPGREGRRDRRGLLARRASAARRRTTRSRPTAAARRTTPAGSREA